MEYTSITAEQLTDRPDPHTVMDSRTVYDGAIWDVCSESFRMTGQEEPLTREFITHPGAVSVVVLSSVMTGILRSLLPAVRPAVARCGRS